MKPEQNEVAMPRSADGYWMLTDSIPSEALDGEQTLLLAEAQANGYDTVAEWLDA